MKKLLAFLVIFSMVGTLLCMPSFAADDVESTATRYEFEDYITGFTATSDLASEGEYVASYSASKATEKPVIEVPVTISEAGLYDITYVAGKKYGGGLVTLTLGDGTNNITVGTNEGDGVLKLEPYKNTANDKTYFPARQYKKEMVWLEAGEYTLSVSVAQTTSSGIKCYLYMLDYIEFVPVPAPVISTEETTLIEFEDYLQKYKLTSDVASGKAYARCTSATEDPNVSIDVVVEKSGYYNIKYIAGKDTSSCGTLTLYLGDKKIGTNADSGTALSAYSTHVWDTSYLPATEFVKEMVYLKEGEYAITADIETHTSEGVQKYIFMLDMIEFTPVPLPVISMDETTTIEFDDYLTSGKASSGVANGGYYIKVTSAKSKPTVSIDVEIEDTGYYNITYIAGKKVDGVGAVTLKVGEKTIGTNDGSGVQLDAYNDTAWDKTYLRANRYEKNMVWLESGKYSVTADVASVKSDGVEQWHYVLDYISFAPVKNTLTNENGAISATVYYKDEVSGTPILALYSGDKLVSAVVSDSVSDTKSVTVLMTLTAEEASTVTDAKMFVWSDMINIAPQTEVVVLEVQ